MLAKKVRTAVSRGPHESQDPAELIGRHNPEVVFKSILSQPDLLPTTPNPWVDSCVFGAVDQLGRLVGREPGTSLEESGRLLSGGVLRRRKSGLFRVAPR